MVYKKSVSERTFDVVNIIFLSILVIICAYPLYYVLMCSLSDPYQLMKHKGILLKPLGFTLNGYKLVFQNPSIRTGFFNTLFYVIAGTFVNMLLTAMSAYVISRKNLMCHKFLMIMITIPMFFSGGLIPFYLQVQRLGLINTRWALIFPSALSIWNLIILRTAFNSVPESLIESAKLDGANDFTILFKIIIPLSKATLAVIALFYAVGHWNSWFNAMIFLRDRTKFPLQLILREILISNETREMMNNLPRTSAQFIQAEAYKTLIKYCTIIVSTLPIVCVYPFIQKYFVKGVMLGSTKE
ncbi:carbohydrate ABC transporter membrane protein 2, CUT1 family [Caloramator quimbayensis]|uniref:Carbohydrate ABC transporter membrane protein 2, CUT1 family n=1 Tax=Caloramator quimbayensis TaxID=1147123 RepID=A0A1T4X089_9CLOT|nr:carbohydrate ABC transporter permease [Caloramator quimbayensis]SKA82974.1 carbohydrate ABC transporter membrane protein 2, CUT1 family [Caloramator quimbayensis]